MDLQILAWFNGVFDIRDYEVGFASIVTGLNVLLLLPIAVAFLVPSEDFVVPNAEESEPYRAGLGHKLLIVCASLVCLPAAIAGVMMIGEDVMNSYWALRLLLLPFCNWNMHKAITGVASVDRIPLLRGWALHQGLCLLVAWPFYLLVLAGF